MSSGLPNSSEIMHQLKGIHLPATREQILEAATKHEADGNVLLVLGHIPDGNYEDASAIAKGISAAAAELHELLPHIPAAEIAAAVAGIKFPATKDQLVEVATDNDASKEVLVVIDAMARNEFRGIVDIGRGIREAKEVIRQRLFDEAGQIARGDKSEGLAHKLHSNETVHMPAAKHGVKS